MSDVEQAPRLLSYHRIKALERLDEVQLFAAPDGHFSLVVNCHKERDGRLIQDYDESWCYTTMGTAGLERTMLKLEQMLGVKLFSG